MLIEPIKEEEKTSSGVFLPESAKDKPMKGRVVAMGLPSLQEMELIDLPRATEDHKAFEDKIVFFKKWGNEEVKEDGKEYVFVKFDDLLAVCED